MVENRYNGNLKILIALKNQEHNIRNLIETLGQNKSDNNDQMIQLTNVTCVL